MNRDNLLLKINQIYPRDKDAIQSSLSHKLV